MLAMSRRASLFCLAAFVLPTTQAAEFHVSFRGDDHNRGSRSAPLQTIQRAADLAQPGDVITVHEGIYRERVNPPRGGVSDRKRITYQAAKGEAVAIRGSEVIKGWSQVQPGVWKVTLPNSMFGAFNPYRDLIRGDWFERLGRDHHTGAVYLNGAWLIEAARLEEVLLPAGKRPEWLKEPDTGLWFAEVGEAHTTLWAQFRDADPNQQQVEINVRQTVFYPDQPGRNYITVRGFMLQHAATPWAPPTAEQIGLIGTHWSRGWIIENNTVSHSVCSGIALGKHGDSYDNTSANTAEGYVKTIERAQAHPIPWTRENIGHHIVRNNTVSHCEQAGIVGSMGCAFSTVTGNTIHDVHVRRLFTGAEMAGIKFHGAIDTTIERNHIYRTCLGLWLDWMAQGTRVSRNVFHQNAGQDLFVEVNHGPFLVDNNLFLSQVNLLDMSEGGAYAHNWFAGRITNRPEPSRDTPFHPAHSTTVAGLQATRGGDNRFYNNIFVGDGKPRPAEPATKELRWITSSGLWGYDTREQALMTGGNVYYNGALPYRLEKDALVLEGNPNAHFSHEDVRCVFRFDTGKQLAGANTVLVTTTLLGNAATPALPYVDRDGKPIRITKDFFGKSRKSTHPTPGPFEVQGGATVILTPR
jgi:alpha-N-arabinofuranosidase